MCFSFMFSSVKWYTNYHCFHIKSDNERGNVLVCYYSKREKKCVIMNFEWDKRHRWLLYSQYKDISWENCFYCAMYKPREK